MSDDDMVTIPRHLLTNLWIGYQRGDALTGWIASTVVLGHASPGSTLDYVSPEPWTSQAFIADFVAWTSGRKSLRPGCDERLREWGAVEARNRVANFTDAIHEALEPTS